MKPQWFPWIMIAAALGGTVPAVAQTAPSTASRPTSPEQINRLIAELGNRSYRVREQAARRLAELGPAAIPFLRKQMNNPRQEIALAVREWMQEFDEVFFCGASVRIEAEPARVRWDEPVHLRIIVHNDAEFPARLPWSVVPSLLSRPTGPASGVGVMLDVADWLEVTGPAGRPVDLRVDPIADDREVEAVVNARAKGGATGLLGPGQRSIVGAREFNRGWARYPLLEKGRYQIRFAYQPEWSRPAWVEAGIGRIVSDPVEIEVTEAAPESIRESAAAARLDLSLDGDDLVARVISTWDRPFNVNLNYGPKSVYHAQFDWLAAAAGRESVPLAVEPEGDGRSGEPGPSRIPLVRPGEGVEVARVSVAPLREAAARGGVPTEGKTLRIGAKYTNFATRETIRQMAGKADSPAARALRDWATEHPYPVLTGALFAPPINAQPQATATRPGT